jgi:hypothetical protein
VTQLRRLHSASRRAIGVMDHAPVQIGRHHILIGFGESGDDADERRAAMNDDGGFVATNAVPSKKCLRPCSNASRTSCGIESSLLVMAIFRSKIFPFWSYRHILA